MEQQEHNLRFNSVQLNIVVFADVCKAIINGSADNAVYMMDNSPSETEQGTSRLQTICKQGQVLNWIIYPMDSCKRADGSWPPSVKISNIVFLDRDNDMALFSSTMTNLKIYGGPDCIRSPFTPVYYYWAGIIPLNLPPGIYPYRLVLELEKGIKGEHLYINLETPSLKVIPIVQ